MIAQDIEQLPFQKKYADSPSDDNVSFHNEGNLQLNVVVPQGGGQLRVRAVHLALDLNGSCIPHSHHWPPNCL